MATSDLNELSDKALFAELTNALRGEPETVPEGFRTSAQWAALWECSLSKVDRLLRHAQAKRIMGRKSFRIANVDGVVRPTPHYFRL